MDSRQRRFKRLVKELGAGSRDQRRYAAMELAYLNNAKAIPHLLNAMRDPVPDVCAAAMTSYGHLAGLLSVPKLLAMMDDSKGWLNYRAAETLENVLISCKSVTDVDLFDKMLTQGMKDIGKRLTGGAMERLVLLKEKARERRADLEACMGGVLSEGKPKPPANGPKLLKGACKISS